MKTKTTTPITKPKTLIKIQMLAGKTAEIRFNNVEQAREYFDQLRTIGVLAGEAIRIIDLVEWKTLRQNTELTGKFDSVFLIAQFSDILWAFFLGNVLQKHNKRLDSLMLYLYINNANRKTAEWTKIIW